MKTKRFGRWTVLSYHSKDKQHRKKHLCKCDCGKIKVVYEQSLKSGKSKSCGCYQKQRATEVHTTHGHTADRTYNTWHKMLQRCGNKNDPGYNDYGGRGITVCKRWYKFINFLSDMGERPENRTIDRVDNDGNYERSNCRWATQSQQNYNQRVQSRNKLGVTGIKVTERKSGKRYTARITIDGHEIPLYYGPSLFEACCNRKEAENKYFNRG